MPVASLSRVLPASTFTYLFCFFLATHSAPSCSAVSRLISRISNQFLYSHLDPNWTTPSGRDKKTKSPFDSLCGSGGYILTQKKLKSRAHVTRSATTTTTTHAQQLNGSSDSHSLNIGPALSAGFTETIDLSVKQSRVACDFSWCVYSPFSSGQLF